jgi:RNA polymerase sigma-70 factor (ECF subfamily)
MQTKKSNIETEFMAIQEQLESYLYRLSANREDAKDLLQDTYIKIKQKVDTFQGKSSFKTWVFAIATNLAKDNQSRKNSRLFQWRVGSFTIC